MPYPADATNTGYQNAPGYPGSLTNGTSLSLADNTTYSFYDFSETGTAINDASFASGTSATGVTFIGCRFASNAVSDACVDTVGTNITYSYCTFEPSTVPAGSEPAISNTAYAIAHGSGYQYGINQTSDGPVTISHCRFWGFANAIQLSKSTLAAPFTITHSLFQNPRADGGVDHTDGPGELNRQTYAITHVTCSSNTVIGAGNTNALAFQGGSGGYDTWTLDGNYLAGYGFMVFIGSQGYQGTDFFTNITFTNNTWGTDVEPGSGPVYNSHVSGGQGTDGVFTLPGYGNHWSGNKISTAAGTSWMAAGNNGLYWWPTDNNPASPSSIIGHARDFVNNLVAHDLAGYADGTSGHVYTFPAGAPSAGNLDVLCVTVWGGSASTPSGWQAGASHSDLGNINMYFFYRLAAGGEGATVTVTTSGSNVGQIGSSRWTGVSGTADANGFAVAANKPTGPATATTGALAQAGELSIAFAAMINGSASPAPVSWSAGYTGMDAAGFDGNSIAMITGYNPVAGTAAESPSVSWTNAYDVYQAILVQTFKAAAAPSGSGVLLASFP